MFKLPPVETLDGLDTSSLYNLAVAYQLDDGYSETVERALSEAIAARLGLKLSHETDLYRASDSPLRVLAASLGHELPDLRAAWAQ